MTLRPKLKILFVCTLNKMRSATAQIIYENDDRFEVKSAGTDVNSINVLNIDVLSWADSVIVMEKHHRNYIRKKFPNIYNSKNIVCLYIDDEYDFMDIELIDLIKQKVESLYIRKLI